MAFKPVDIGIAADTRAFERDIKSGVVDELDKVVDSLEKVSHAGDDAGGDLEDSMVKAQRATDDLADEHKDLQRIIEDGSKSSFRKFEKASDDATDKASEGVSEFKSEATANFSEVASSFSGDMDSAIDLVQGTLGGLAGSIPGVGIALAGVGAAAGLFYNKWKENAEAVKARIQEMYDDMAESGAEFLSEEYVTEQINKIVIGADGAAISMKNLQRISDDTGISQSDLLRAFGGDLKTRNRIIDKLKGQIVNLGAATERASKGMQTAADEQTIASAEALRKLKDQNAEAGKAAEAVNAQREAISGLHADQGRMYADDRRNQGVAIDNLGTIKEAAEAIPTDIKSKVTVSAKVNVDQKALYTGIQGALDKKTFKVFTNAYTAPNRNGTPKP